MIQTGPPVRPAHKAVADCYMRAFSGGLSQPCPTWACAPAIRNEPSSGSFRRMVSIYLNVCILVAHDRKRFVTVTKLNGIGHAYAGCRNVAQIFGLPNF